MEGGGGIGGGDAVAGVAADGADVSDLGTADLVHGLAQHTDIFLDQGVTGDMGEAGERADAQSAAAVHGDAADLIQGLDGDQLRTCPFAFPHLHQHVGAAGDDLGVRMGQTEGYGVCYAFCLIQGFHVIHMVGPPLLFNKPRLFKSAIEDMGRDGTAVDRNAGGV